MYLVVMGIVAIVLTMSGPLFRLVTETWQVLAVAAGATLVPPIVGAFVARRARGILDRHPDQPSLGQAALGHGVLAAQILIAAGQSGLLLLTDWMRLCERVPVVGTWPLVPGLLTLVPLLVCIVAFWIAIYPADRAVRQIALELYLYRGKPVRRVWPLFQYLNYNLRHQVLFVLVPMLLILAAHDFVVRYHGPIRAATRLEYGPDLLVGLAAILVAVVTPEILRHVWVTQRLPDGPLRDRLLWLSRKLGLRYREVLVWRSGGMIVNAAVMGVVAPLRYVLITDAMLEQMDDDKIEAVFGHEAGHVKRHHIFYFLLFALISGSVATSFTLRTHGLATSRNPQDLQLYQLLMLALSVFLLFKWGLAFGWISRRFERQADIFGTRALALRGLPCSAPCLLHTPPEDPRPRPGDPLCSTAAQLFSAALHEVAVLNGIRPAARSWRHSSIESRSRFIHELAADPARLRRFEGGVHAIKAAVLLVAVLSMAWAAYDLQLWRVLGAWGLG